ncbi:hypothetical protein [Streptomyces sp. NPDC048338]|uniref:hypothetical protein n=1 Tax=Streptomyces sp. NPDC048338 TaxID=3365536 RepID=UPI00371894EF
MADQPTPSGATTHPQGPDIRCPAAHASTTLKVMSLMIAALCGLVGLLAAFVLTRHLGADPLLSVGSSAATFLGVTGAVTYTEERLGLL